MPRIECERRTAIALRHWSLDIRHSAFRPQASISLAMPRFTYVALDARGQESTGLVEAASTQRRDRPTAPGRIFPDQCLRRRHRAAARWKTQRRAAKATRRRARDSGRKGKGHRSFPAQDGQAEGADDFHPAARDPDRFRPAAASAALTVLAKQERDPVLEEHDQSSWPIPCRAAAPFPTASRNIRASSTISTSTW